MTDQQPNEDPEASAPRSVLPVHESPAGPIAGGFPISPVPGSSFHPPPIPVLPSGSRPFGAQLAYSTPMYSGQRPGILTALAIISLIVSCLSGFSSFTSGMEGVVFAFLSNSSMAAARTPPGVTTTTTISGGTSTTYTSYGVGPGPGPGMLAGPTTAPAALTPAEIQLVISKVQASTTNGLNPAQVTSLRTALQTNNPPLVTSTFVYSPIQSATMDGNGGVDIAFNGGTFLSIDGKGLVTNQGTAGGVAGFPKIGYVEAGVMLVDGLLSVALAIILFIGAIQIFRSSRSALKLHRWYAWAKLPVGVLGAAGMALFYRSMFNSIGAAGVGGSMSVVVWSMFITYVGLSCAYPVAVLLVLRTQAVRTYYASVSSAP